MNRLMCWLCSRRLTYVKNKPKFDVFVDPIGAEHKVHKACIKREEWERGEQRRKDFSEFANRGDA